MENESLIRLAVFLGLFALFAVCERIAPRRETHPRRPRRWLTNLSMSILNAATLRMLAFGLPLLAVGAALDASTRGYGLFNALGWPTWIETILAIFILDLAIWGQHLISHKIPVLWRLHRVHHADTEIDVTTAVRFHPVEIALSMLFKIGLVYLLGASALSVLLFEILLNGTALFNHSNIKLPLAVDAPLRKILVTPDMHRVHHSVRRQEHDSNYGFALSIWDRLMGTYVAQPAKGHEGMIIGLGWQDERPSRLSWSLLLPFRRR